MKNFVAENANDLWIQAFDALRDDVSADEQPSRAGLTRELLHVTFTLKNPRERWIVAREPALNPAFAVAELVWIINGRNQSAILNYFNKKLPRFAGDGETYHGAYGFRIINHFKIDQLTRVYETLKNNPDSRQAVLQIWDPMEDLPDSKGQPRDMDIPCNISSIIKIRRNRLEWFQIMRSNDLFLGTPYNFVQWTSVQEIMAGWLGVGLGEYNQLSDSLHVYKRDLGKICVDDLAGNIRNADSLDYPKEVSDRAFKELYEKIDRMTKVIINEKDLEEICEKRDAVQSYQNMLLVVGAECARRRGWKALQERLIGDCTNPLYSLLSERWVSRVTSKMAQ
jgi:thymidylate synthase